MWELPLVCAPPVGARTSVVVTEKTERVSRLLLLGDLLFYFAVLVAALIWRHDQFCILGSAIALPSFALWFAAKLQLGASFTLKAEARQLVTRGLYSKIRHPVYLFSTCAMLGIAICLRSVYFDLYLAIVIGLQVWRIRREEQVLREKFGQAHLDYRRQTWF